MESPKVSIIIPVYNSQRTILETLDSLENQTFHDFEVVIINDGSTDSSDKLIQDWIKGTTINVTYHYQENKGVSLARNKGLTLSKGKYISFLDSDDLYSPFFLESLVNAIEREHVDVAICQFTRNGHQSIKMSYDIKRLDRYSLLSLFMNIRKMNLSFFCLMYQSNILKKHKISFSRELAYGEDLEFLWKYLLHCENAIFIKEGLYVYKDQPESAINTVTWEMTHAIESVNRVYDYMKNLNEDFAEEYYSFMYPRMIWKVAKDFSNYKSADLLKQLGQNIDVKKAMKNMTKNGENIFVRLSASLYLVSPLLFYYVINSFSKIK